jgi:hypothetical protein
MLAVNTALLLNGIAIAGVLFYLYRRTILHRWDGSLIAIPILINIVLMVFLNRLKRQQESNV